MWGTPFDYRAFVLNLDRHPDQSPAALKQMMDEYRRKQRK